VIRVFPAWPKEWDASYTLLARGNFLVTSSRQGGAVEFIEIMSQSGGECKIRNPWGESEVSVFKNGREWNDMSGSLLKFGTEQGENFVIIPKGIKPDQYKRVVLGE
jgi:hypothetical protein